MVYYWPHILCRHYNQLSTLMLVNILGQLSFLKYFNYKQIKQLFKEEQRLIPELKILIKEENDIKELKNGKQLKSLAKIYLQGKIELKNLFFVAAHLFPDEKTKTFPSKILRETISIYSHSIFGRPSKSILVLKELQKLMQHSLRIPNSYLELALEIHKQRVRSGREPKEATTNAVQTLSKMLRGRA